MSHLRSLLVTMPLIVLYTIIMASLSIISSLFDSTGKLQHGCARFWSRLILWTSRVKPSVTGLENLRDGVPYVFCANHQSYMDIPILLVTVPLQFRFAAKKELFRVPFLGWHLRRSGHVAIDRENPHAALKSLREATDRIGSGAPVIIFPEGRTSLDGHLQPFKGGGFMLADRAGAAVVPVTIRGSRAILARDSTHIRGGKAEVFVGRPIPPGTMSADALSKAVYEEIHRVFYAHEDRERAHRIKVR